MKWINIPPQSFLSFYLHRFYPIYLLRSLSLSFLSLPISLLLQYRDQLTLFSVAPCSFMLEQRNIIFNFDVVINIICWNRELRISLSKISISPLHRQLSHFSFLSCHLIALALLFSPKWQYLQYTGLEQSKLVDEFYMHLDALLDLNAIEIYEVAGFHLLFFLFFLSGGRKMIYNATIWNTSSGCTLHDEMGRHITTILYN